MYERRHERLVPRCFSYRRNILHKFHLDSEQGISSAGREEPSRMGKNID